MIARRPNNGGAELVVLNKALAIMVAIGTLVGHSRAEGTNYTSIQSGSWRDQQSWWPVGVPMCGDTVTIQNGHTIEVDQEEEATALTVLTGGQLNLIAYEGCAGTLTICAAGTGSFAVDTADGVALVGDGSELRFEQSVTIGGTGSIQGLENDSAVVLMTSAERDVTLTSLIAIHGALSIKESGAGKGFFYNAGGVTADLPGQTLQLHASLDGVVDIPSSCTGPLWSVVAAGAVLRFATGADLEGAFRVGPGTLDVDAPVHTDGKLTFASGGAITPAPFACFSYGGHCGNCQLFPWQICSPARCH